MNRPTPTDELERLREEVAYLRSELIVEDNLQVAVFLRETYGLWPKAGNLLHALYQANGRVISKPSLADMIRCEDNSGRSIDAYVWKIRNLLGRDAIQTLVGQGLRIGPAGSKAIEKAMAA